MTDPNDPLPDELPEEEDEKTVMTGPMGEPAVRERVVPESESVPEPILDPEPVTVGEQPQTESGSNPESHLEAPPPTAPETPSVPPSKKEVPDPNPGEEPEIPPENEDEKSDEQVGGGRKPWSSSTKRRRFRVPRLPAVRPFRTIVILLVIIFLLLWLIWHFGLGGGGEGLLPGNPDPGQTEAVEEVIPVEEEKPAVRRELNVSFFPSLADPETAQELACNLDWTDSASGSQESRRVVTENMDYFEFQLEKTIRTWRLSLGTGETQDIPVVSVCMTPFPGEGVFRKIESIAQRIDPKISILRLETTVPAISSE